MKILPSLEEVKKIAETGKYDVLPVSTEILSDFTTPLEPMQILKNVSTNEGAGGIASAGAGLGMGLSMGGVFGGMSQQMQGQAQTAPVNSNPMDKLKQLKDMLDMGLISQADFDSKKNEILKTL